METITKKYRLLENDTRTVDGKTLYRIEALKDFGSIEKGNKGGYIEKEGNLSQEGNCWVYEEACVYEGGCVYEEARVYGESWVYGKACVSGAACVAGKARVYGESWVYGKACVSGAACVDGKVWVYGDTEVYGDAEIRSTRDFVVLKNIWSSGRYFTYTRSNKMWKVGCFYGTGEELIAKAYRDSEVSGREYERVVKYVEAMYADLEKDKE